MFKRKFEPIDIFAYIIKFENENKSVPGTAMIANKFGIDGTTARRYLKELNDMGKIRYKDSGAYHTQYEIV